MGFLDSKNTNLKITLATVLTFSLWSCGHSELKDSNQRTESKTIEKKEPQKKGKEQSQKLKNTKAADTKIHGQCKIMNTPGISPELFTRCNQFALMLIYKKAQKAIVSVIRTQEDGHFEFQVPPFSNWTLTSASREFQANLEFLPEQNGISQLVIILKPK